MKQSVVRLLGSYLGLVFLLAGHSASIAAPQVVQGTVKKIVDGDTVHLDARSAYSALSGNLDLYASADPQNDLKIRMLGIDAPETHFPSKKHGVVGQQPWGDEATKYLGQMIKVGGVVAAQTWGLDKFKRTLGFIFSNKIDINLQMVRAGWAVPYEICSGPACTRKFFTDYRVRDYLASCDAARKERRGVYNPQRPLPELPYEFRMRTDGRAPEKFVGNYDTMEFFEPKEFKKIDLCRRIFFFTKAEALRAGFKYKASH
jgi:endonuclease YncB( thermonuclease family)